MKKIKRKYSQKYKKMTREIICLAETDFGIVLSEREKKHMNLVKQCDVVTQRVHYFMRNLKKKMRYQNHYDYLDKNLKEFFKKCGLSNFDQSCYKGIISAHGDKAYGYRDIFEKNGINFYHGVAIYLLTYCNPYAKEVRDTKDGWVPVEDWIVKNKDKFLPLLNPADFT